MSPHHLRRLKVAAAWTFIALAGVAAGAWNYRSHDEERASQLVRSARRAAIAFDLAEVRRLTGEATDAGSASYAAVKARLQRFKEVDSRIRLLYLFRHDPATKRTVFLADSSARGAPHEAAPGAPLPRGVASPALQRLLQTGQPGMDGPFRDDTGTWVISYALIGEVAAAAHPEPRNLLAVEVDAAGWPATLWQGAFEGAFYVWIVLALPFAAWSVMRRQFEQREVIRNLSEAMEQSHSAIVIIDLEARIEYANRGLCQQLGYTRREMLGRPWRDFQDTEGDAALLSDLVATVRSGQAWEGEWVNCRKDGTVYPVRGVVTPVKHRDGALACYVAVFDDVTETKAREAELREARDLAQAGDRAKGQFLATMSHEVRTPLNGIVGFTSLLLETPLSSEQREYVQTIRMSTEALIQLTGDILDFARIESGKLKLDPVACDPRECIEDALDLLATRAAEKKLELLHHVSGDVPAAVITDGGRLRQVLVNLVGNAVKFTEHGVVEVSVRPARGSRPPEVVPEISESVLLEFSVRDTGIGIAREHHEKLFRPFTQVDDSTTRRYGGTGLGLAICRNLVEMMGGTITVASELGQGATFIFTVAATVAAPLPPARDLNGLRLGLAMRGGPLRTELGDLVRSWHGEVIEAEVAEALPREGWEMAMIEVDEEIARELALQAAPSAQFPPGKTLALVPISLPNELRSALRVHFRLLVNKPVHHEALFSLLAGTRASTPVVPRPTQFGLRVLVVEDNPINQRLVQRIMTHLGCTPTVVGNGREALRVLADSASAFDLMLLDLHMPEMDGLAVLREIRGGGAGTHAQAMWIVAVTADVREQQRAKAVDAGVNDYLTKPLNHGDLEGALKRFRGERTARKS